MDHPSAHERLADLALEPARLATLDGDASPDAVALRAHVASCTECAAELAGWRRMYATFSLAATTAEGEPGRLRDLEREPSAAPPELRDRVLRQVAGIEAAGPPRAGAPSGLAVADGPGSARAAGADVPATASDDEDRATGASAHGSRGPGRRAPRLAWLAVAAAIVIAVVSGVVAVDRDQQLTTARAQAADLASVAATLDRILAAPTHDSVALKAADGSVGGVLTWSPAEIAVVTSALPPPTGGASYRCWVERAGVRTPVGAMSFAGETGYWAGSTGPWGWSISTGDRFGVSLVPADGGSPSPVLVAQL